MKSPATFGKDDPRYWRQRLFRARYFYKGKTRAVRNWSVKIQHQGRRKTLALSSSRRNDAAAEACQIYRQLVSRGWEAAQSSTYVSWDVLPSVPKENASGPEAPPQSRKLSLSYWAQRLIHREYTMDLRPQSQRELSVRIDHAGTGHYFPLGTPDSHLAAEHAREIYEHILAEGWESAKLRYPRELTVAIRWLGLPLCWTYSTIHTVTAGSHRYPAGFSRAGGFRVAVVESDPGIRRALVWCINQMDGFRCSAAFRTAAEVAGESPGNTAELVLVSYNLEDKPGTVCLSELQSSVPGAMGVLYSVYEDSEELFRKTPGGAGTYLLRRTSPSHFLDPLAEGASRERLARDGLAPAVWQYFKDSLGSMPVGVGARQLANLTQRELEVLEWLSKGHPDKEIADQLQISIYTVHEHVRNIFEKLGAHNRTEAAVRFLQK